MTPPRLTPALGVVLRLKGACSEMEPSWVSVTERLWPGSIQAPLRPFGAAESGAGYPQSPRVTPVTSVLIVTDEEFVRTMDKEESEEAPLFTGAADSERESPNAFRAKLPPITTATIRIAMSAPNHG